MSEDGDDTNLYKLYAVVHVDMLNASFFGLYICYTKGFTGNWYGIDDCKVLRVELEEVLSQGACMLLYSRVSPRPSCLSTSGMKAEAEHCSKEQTECVPEKESISYPSHRVSLPMNGCLHSEISIREVGSPTGTYTDAVHGHANGDVANSTSSVDNELSFNENGSRFQIDSEAIRINGEDRNRVNSIAVRENVENNSTSSQPYSSDMDGIPSCDKDPSLDSVSEAENTKMVETNQQYLLISTEVKNCEQDSRVPDDYEMEDSEGTRVAYSEASSSVAAGG